MTMARRVSRTAAVPVIAAGAAGAAVLGVRARRRRDLPAAPVGIGVPTRDGLILRAAITAPEGPARGAIVFAHGWTMAGEFWDAHARAVAREGYLAVTYDQRGHGRSGRPRRDGYDLHHLGDDLAAVLEQLVTPGLPGTLVGHSMGAMTVMAWAGRPEPRTRAVTGAVLANTAARGVVGDALGAMTGTTNPAVHQLVRQIVKVPAPIPAGPLTPRVVAALAHGEASRPEAVALTTRLVRACHPAVRVGFAHQIDALDLHDRSLALDVPTLVVTSTRDLLTPPVHAERLAADLPDARLHVMPGLGHQAPIEDVDGFTHLVLRHAAGRRPDGDRYGAGTAGQAVTSTP